MESDLTTVEVALLLSRELGIRPALSEREINNALRSWPADQLPPVQGNRRQWGEHHVQRLREDVARRGSRRATG